LPRILVVAPNWIGDALMAQPLFTRLKRSGAHLDVLAPELHDGVGPPAGARVLETDRLHGAETKRVDASSRQLFNWQTCFKPAGFFETL